LSFALPALAIRVVFNGGGYGEMVVLNSFMMMPQVLKALAQDSKELSAGEASLIRLAQTPSIFEAVKVDFFSNQNSPVNVADQVRYPSVNHISMLSEMLYDSDGKALDVGKLWSIAFEAWANMPSLREVKADHGITRANVKQIAQRLVEGLRNKIEYLVVKVEQVQVHSLTFDQNSSLMVEFEKGTVDVTSTLKSALQCEAGALQKVWVKSLTSSVDAMTGRVVWQCGERVYNGEIMMQVPSDLTLENAMQALQIQVHSVTVQADSVRVFTTFNPCDDQLLPKN